MKKLVPIRQLIEESEEDGSVLFIDPDDVCSVDPDELADSEENPDEGED